MKAILYARSLNDKIKIWSIYHDKDKIVTLHGYFNDSTSNNLIKHASNVTMSSANAEIKSKIKKKQREGYKTLMEVESLSGVKYIPTSDLYMYLNSYLPVSNIDADYNLKPMKCAKFVRGKMRYPAIAQFKLNGVRAVLRWETITIGEGIFAGTTSKAVIRSKSGLIYHLPHITDGLTKEYFIDSETGLNLAYDGEIYLHNTPLNMISGASPLINDRNTIAKTKYPHITPQLKFVIFDIAIESVSQGNRSQIIESIPVVNASVNKLESIIVNSDDEVAAFTIKALSLGYEGAVIRDIDAEYKFGSRPMSIMKSKDFIDGEFIIVDVIPKLKEPETGLFVMSNDINDYTFKCNPMGDYIQRKEYLDNKDHYIGKLATIKYYERSGIKDVPFHANVVAIRDYE